MCPPKYPPDVSVPRCTVMQNIRIIQDGGIFRQLLLDLSRPATLEDILGWLLQRDASLADFPRFQEILADSLRRSVLSGNIRLVNGLYVPTN